MDSPPETPKLLQAQPQPPAHLTSRRGRRTRIVGGLIALVAMAALSALAWHLTHPAAGAGGPAGGRAGGRGAPATTVGVATAEKADIPVVLDALGTVTAAATVTVRAQVSGILQSIMFKEGQMVKAGQVLATIDPRQFQMALLQASGQRVRDEAQLDSARVTLVRYHTLLGQDSIARQDVDTQDALVKQLQGTVMTDRAAEGMARLNLAYCQVLSPISGRVGLRVVDVGNLVSTSDVNGLALITQLSPIDVVFSVPQDQVPDVLASVAGGAQLPAIALDRTRNSTLDSGRFAALDNQVDIQTGTVRAKARFANAKVALFPSQFVNVRLELRTIKDAVMVPVTALRHGGSGDFVYVLNAAQHTVALRPVTRGQATVDKVQIRTGLQAGEQVITEGADRLKNGAKVTLPGDKPATPGGRRGNRGPQAGQSGAAPDAASAMPPGAASVQSGAAAEGATPGQHRRHRPDASAVAASAPPAAAQGPAQ